jgi:hypothetical protein
MLASCCQTVGILGKSWCLEEYSWQAVVKLLAFSEKNWCLREYGCQTYKKNWQTMCFC